VSIEDTDMDALLAMARLDGDSGPATPLDRAALDREMAGLFARRDALLRTRRRWYVAAAGGLLVGAGVLATFGLREVQGSGALAQATVEAPRAASSTAVSLVVPDAPPAQVKANELPAIDVTSLPTAAASAPTYRTSVASAASPSSVVVPSPPSSSDVEQAEDLLRTANRLRAEKSWAEATRTYELVIAKYERSGPSYPATLAAAALRLERLSDPAGALRLYQRASSARPTGPLAEEARFGEARAHRALGQTDAERTTLRTFLSSYPSSWRADEARARLRELGEIPHVDGSPASNP
jgi:tetratricopeptide (TPR) repeat protein